MQLAIGLEGTSSRDCAHLAYTSPDGQRQEVVLRRGDVVRLPGTDGVVEIVSATHGTTDAAHVLRLDRPQWVPIPAEGNQD